MSEFDKEVEKIGTDNSSEINGELKAYFTVLTTESGRYKLVWEKKTSTHIRHKVAALVKKHFVSPPLSEV